MAVVADLALARNLLAVTQRFREAGARDHAIHDVLARLQHGAAAQGLESFVELGASATEQTATEPSADGAGERSGALATVTLYWEHFMLDLLSSRATTTPTSSPSSHHSLARRT